MKTTKAMEQDNELIIDRFEPDYEHGCDNCGTTPTVTGVHNGKIVYLSGMCGPCLWGEAKCLDPAEWNTK